MVLLVIILLHLGVSLFDKYHPRAEYIRGLTCEERRHQAHARKDISLEEMSHTHHKGHSGKTTKDTEYIIGSSV